MNDNQAMEIKEVIDGVLDRWSPDKSESFEIRTMRALLFLNAFEKDSERFRNGEDPIRTDYPIPL